MIAIGFGTANTQGISPEQIVALRKASDPQISPDGRYVTFGIDQTPDPAAGEVSTLWLALVDSPGIPRKAPGTTQGDHDIRWAPRSSVFAFVSERGKSAQLYIAGMNDTIARPISSSPNGVSSYGWSPDGKQIAYIAPDTATVRKRFPKTEAVEVTRPNPNRIWITGVGTATTRQLTQKGDVRELAWAPNGSELAVILSDSTGDDDHLVLSIVDVRTGVIKRNLADNVSSVTPRVLRWSSNGALVSYFQNAPSQHAFWLAVAPSAGGNPIPVLKDFPGTVMQAMWLDQPDELMLVMLKGVEAYLMRVNARSGTELSTLRVNTSQASWGLSTNGSLVAYLAETSTSPPDVWVIASELRSPVQLTTLNPATRSLPLGEVRTISWKNSVDQLALDGVVILPHDYTAGRRYPMVVQMHPGDLPWWAGFIGSWSAWGQLLASHGYVVFLPNYRGGNAYGWKRRETLADWGGLALQDMLDGVDKLVRDGIADPDRLGIGGWSNGGFMTEWAITHDSRFKAAVAEAAHANFYSLYGTTTGYIKFGNTPYMNREPYDAHSPITYVRNLKTPVLLLHGQDDRAVPVTQSQEFYHAATERGVEAELVIYPGAGHGISKATQRVDIQARVLDWFDRHLKS
jgi:dipeptidyl aminopeptidase/acylaminoacyl peptidase